MNTNNINTIEGNGIKDTNEVDFAADGRFDMIDVQKELNYANLLQILILKKKNIVNL